jgi:hypothetical protein
MGRSVSWWSWPHLRGDSRRRTAVMSVRSFGVVVTLAALVLAGAACGTRDHFDLVLRSPTSPSDSPPHPQPGTEPTRGRGSQEFIARALVLEDRSHGPQICLGGVAQSLPPQCGGPDLIGWNWKQLAGFEKRNGSRWGEFVVVGSYDPTANTLTLTRPAVPADEYDGPRFSDHGPEPAWSTPCPEPAAGWRVIDPALTTQESQDWTRRAAQSRPDFGQLWVDQSINPALEDGFDSEDELAVNDPTKLILNISVTGNVEEAEADLRTTWGGALCVSKAQHTERELAAVQGEISRTPGLLSIGMGRTSSTSASSGMTAPCRLTTTRRTAPEQ